MTRLDQFLVTSVASQRPRAFKSALIGVVAGALSIATPILVTTQTATAATAATNLVAAKRLNKLLNNTRSMSASFTQTTAGAKSNSHSLIAGNGKFSGRMDVERPYKFRWQIQKPDNQLIVANGNTLWIYDKDLQQATKQTVDNQVGNTPALLLSGNPSQIAKNFKITQPNAKKNYYVLYPKANSANFKNLAISFNGGKPVMMVLNDSLGQTTSIRFNNINLNHDVANSKFSFTPPKGVDVVNQ